MKFLLGQRRFNNNIFFFLQLELICIQETTMLQNKIKKIKDKFNGIQVTNFHNRSTESLAELSNLRTASINQASKTTRVL